MKTKKINAIFGKWFWISSVLVGLLVTSITFAISVHYDELNAEQKLSTTIEFIKERAASYTKYNDTAAARSLVRSSVSVNALEDKTDLDSQEALEKYADELWLTGISILDNDGNLVAEYTTDGVGYNNLYGILEFSVIQDVSINLDKTYIKRITLNDNSYMDVAAHGKSDQTGIILAYRHTKKEFKDKSVLSVQNIVNGYDATTIGSIYIVNNDEIVASNVEEAIGENISENTIFQNIRLSGKANKLVRLTKSNKNIYGMYSHGRENYIYAYLPTSSMFASTIRNVITVVLFYVIVMIFVQILRWNSTKKFLTEQAEQEEMYKEQLEQKNKELELSIQHEEAANRSKREFLFNMSHDIRTPMNAIIGFTSLAATHVDNKEQVVEYLKKISISSQHLLSLINDVLDMSRIESGKVKIEEKPVHLPDLIHDIRAIIQSNIATKRLSLLIDTMNVVDEDIIADPLRLNQILLNILSNAMKFTPTGGTISLKIKQNDIEEKDEAEYEFRIKDTGIGISNEFQQHIFEEFSREESTTVSGIQGTGLGMAITKKIVDLMHGTIEVHSEQGVGTEFIVVLRFKLSGQKIEYTYIRQLEGVRALVADDDTDSCLNICKMLRTIGMRPDWTISGKEAVIRAKDANDQNDKFNVYIIDWMIPDMNGIEVVRNVRKFIGEDTPIIILTAYDYSDIEEEAREAGVTAFCSKPLFMSELREVLEKPFSIQTNNNDEDINVNFEGKRVLLAEDNDLNQEIAKVILEERGIIVETVNNGKEAIEAITKNDASYYDLVLMDVQMPVMDGYEATKQIRNLSDKNKANVIIYAMTANAFEEDKRDALEAGMDGHIAKPFDVDKLTKTLSSIFK